MAFPEDVNICKFYWGGGFYNILNAPPGGGGRVNKYIKVGVSTLLSLKEKKEKKIDLFNLLLMSLSFPLWLFLFSSSSLNF